MEEDNKNKNLENLIITISNKYNLDKRILFDCYNNHPKNIWRVLFQQINERVKSNTNDKITKEEIIKDIEKYFDDNSNEDKGTIESEQKNGSKTNDNIPTLPSTVDKNIRNNCNNNSPKRLKKTKRHRSMVNEMKPVNAINSKNENKKGKRKNSATNSGYSGRNSLPVTKIKKQIIKQNNVLNSNNKKFSNENEKKMINSTKDKNVIRIIKNRPNFNNIYEEKGDGSSTEFNNIFPNYQISNFHDYNIDNDDFRGILKEDNHDNDNDNNIIIPNIISNQFSICIFSYKANKNNKKIITKKNKNKKSISQNKISNKEKEISRKIDSPDEKRNFNKKDLSLVSPTVRMDKNLMNRNPKLCNCNNIIYINKIIDKSKK
jgi:hypothetical protein